MATELVSDEKPAQAIHDADASEELEDGTATGNEDPEHQILTRRLLWKLDLRCYHRIQNTSRIVS
jgi:hypothetical protein